MNVLNKTTRGWRILGPLIFLDIDGVLVTWQSPTMRLPTMRCVRWLNELTTRTSAALVISSTWRHGKTVSELASLLASWGAVAPVVGKTPEDRSVSCRGENIAAYLVGKSNPPFVIIDDDNDMGNLSSHLVQTDFMYGLCRHHVRRAVKMFRGQAELRLAEQIGVDA